MGFYRNEMIEVMELKLAGPPDVSPEGYDTHLAEAISTYSLHRPQTEVQEVTGDGTFDYALPSDFLDGFSSLVSLEYPYDADDQAPPMLVEGRDYLLYRSPTALRLRLLRSTPATTEKYRLTYTVTHKVTVSSSTIAEPDARSVCNLAAGLLAEQLAAEFEKRSRSTMPDVTLDLRTKAQDYQTTAERMYKLYNKYMGIPEDGRPRAASEQIDSDWLASFGGVLQAPLSHPRSMQ